MKLLLVKFEISPLEKFIVEALLIYFNSSVFYLIVDSELDTNSFIYHFNHQNYWRSYNSKLSLS